MLIGDVYGESNGVIHYLQEHDLEFSWVDRLPNVYQIRAVVGLLSNIEYPNAVQMENAFEDFLDLYFGDKLYDWTGLWDVLIKQGGYAPTPESAEPNDQIFTIFVGFDAVARLLVLNDMMYNNLLSNLEQTIDDWLLEVSTNRRAPSFAEWLQDAGAARWL